MAELKICSFNVKGFNKPERRSQILYAKHKQRFSILLLQETHFKSSNVPPCSNKYYPVWYHSSNPMGSSKGVSIGFHKSFSPQVLDSKIDPNGRFIFLRLSFSSRIIVLANLYFPNQGQLPFARTVFDLLRNFAGNSPIILGGDFNLPLDPGLDTSSGRSSLPFSVSRGMKKLLSTLHLVDVWRMLNPTSKDFSFYSPVHNAYSRIDYIFLSHSLLEFPIKAEIASILWSDHAPVWSQIQLSPPTRSPPSWRLNDNLLTDVACLSDIRNAMANFITDHAHDTTSPTCKWEALKCVLRGIFISHGARLKRIRTGQIPTIINKIQSLEQVHKRSLLESVRIELSDARHELLKLLDQKSLCLRDRYRGGFYQHGNKSGRWLAHALHPKPMSNHIMQLSSSSRGIIFKTSEILDEFKQYYSSLYSIQGRYRDLSPTNKISKINDYLKINSLPSISPDISGELEGDFAGEELQLVIKDLKNGKAPGPDGFSPRFYKTFNDQLAPLFLEVCNSISSSCPFQSQSLTAHITVIPKPGKDPNVCGNYRPISLINTDLKIYAKMIANRLRPLLPSIIHPDQVGFIPGREARDNTIRTLSLISHSKSKSDPICLLSVDAEKAFDRVDWDFLKATLKHVGIGDILLARIMALYSNPTARIKLNGQLSQALPIFNGTRQGCPLSPLLYALSMEPLAVALRRNEDVRGVEVGGESHKLALYADDLLMYVTSPVTTLPNILKEFERYGALSNYKVNTHKSELLNISLPPHMTSVLRDSFPFKWQNHHVKYLGVQIPSDLTQLFKLNYNPLLTSLTEDFSKWAKGSLSWFGKMAALKMDILPRVLYYFQTLPIPLPRWFFRKITSLMLKFIWNQSRPRLKLTVLQRRKEDGGVGLPDFFHYYVASRAGCIIDLFHGINSKRWVSLEYRLSPLPPTSILWLPPSSRPSLPNKSFLMTSLIPFSDQFIGKSPLSSRPGPLTPVFGNPDFPEGIHKHSLCSQPRSPRTTIYRFLASSCLKPLTHLVTDPSSNTDWLVYRQLQSFYLHLDPKSHLHRDLLPFESLCTRDSYPTRLISTVYNILRDERSSTSVPLFQSKWESDLGRSFSPEEWVKIYTLTHKSSLSGYTQEKNFKVLSRWYRTPEVLHKMYPTTTNICWRCGGAIGSFMHIWWDCPEVQSLWKRVFSLHDLVTSTSSSCVPEIGLLSLIPGPIRFAKKNLLRHFLAASRQTIAAHWKQSGMPPLAVFFERLNYTMRMEELAAFSEERTPIFFQTWQPWILFKESDSFQTWLLSNIPQTATTLIPTTTP